MKCPQCARQHRHKSGMTCSCGYQFCLDPKSDGIADGKFLAMIRKASGNGTYYFTENQLYTVYCRGSHWSRLGLLLAFVLLGSVVAGLALSQSIWAIPLGVGFVAFAVGVALKMLFFPPSRQKLQGWIAKWKRCGHDIDKLITEPRLHTPPPEWSEPDIYDYGVEGVLVVQRDLLADLLVLNGFHSAKGVLVLSENGYPEYLLPRARKCLEESTELPVYLLHDADAGGLSMEARIRESDLLPLEGHPVLDLGITPDDARNMKRLKATKPQRVDYAVPVDVIPYAVLVGGLGVALSQQTALGELIVQHHAGGSADAGVDIDFG